MDQAANNYGAIVGQAAIANGYQNMKDAQPKQSDSAMLLGRLRSLRTRIQECSGMASSLAEKVVGYEPNKIMNTPNNLGGLTQLGADAAPNGFLDELRRVIDGLEISLSPLEETQSRMHRSF